MARLKGIFLRGKKYWFRFSHAGRQHRVNLETESETEAIEKALDYRANPELLPSDTILTEIRAYAREKLRVRSFSQRSHDETIRVLGGFVAFSQVEHAHSITTGEVQRWYDWLKTGREVSRKGGKTVTVPGLTEESAQTYVARLGGFFTYLVKSNKVRQNPVNAVKMAKLITQARRIFCAYEQRDKLILACKRPDLKYVLFAGFHSGLRKGEIIESDASWFDLEHNVIHVPANEFWNPKGKENRDIPLTIQFKKFILTTKPFKGTLSKGKGYMLHPEKEKGKYRYRWDFRRPFDDLAAQQKMEWVTAHVMRKTFASLLVSANVSIFKVAIWLGDDIETTQKNYAYLLPKDDEIELAFSDLGKKRKKPPDQSVVFGKSRGFRKK
ncbi:MAG: tyrosine-type recombinase/integrase [Terrimicrobiaceae bacterium]